jgi:hypothetical protein
MKESDPQMTLRMFGYVLAVLILAGCAGSRPSYQPENVNLSGYPPAYRVGYRDGCDSARQLIGSHKDAERFKTDSQYANGWRDGYDLCKRK